MYSIKRLAVSVGLVIFIAAPALASAQTSQSDLQNQVNGQAAMLATMSPNFVAGTSTGPALSIIGIYGSAQLQMTQSGTWLVYAIAATSTDPLRYSASWDDNSSSVPQLSSNLMHAYARAGTYHPKFTVTDASSTDVANASVSVLIYDNETATTTTPTCPSITTTLSIGMTSAQVIELQQFLTRYFNLNGSLVTGTFGTLTEGYVKQFQAQNGISQLGYVGPQTRDAIARVCHAEIDQVQVQDTKIGTGAQAAPGSAVSVLYVGTFQNGTVFDSSAMHGNQPLQFTLGDQSVISGFQIGINGMKAGGERRITIPPSLGYGASDVKDASGNVIIPANSTLIFDITLVSVGTAPDPDTASFSASPTPGSAPLAVTFAGNTGSASYFGGVRIDFGDSTTSTVVCNPGSTCSSISATHTYSTAGTYTAKLVGVGEGTTITLGTALIVVLSDDEGGGGGLTCPAFTTITLAPGMTDSQTGGQVSQLQQFLTDYFHLDGSLVVGTFGQRTERYVQQFQSENGIQTVGYVGQQTRAAILAACRNSNPSNFTFAAVPSQGTVPLSVDFSYSDPNQGDVFNIDYGNGDVGSMIYNVGTNCSGPGGCAPRYDAWYTYPTAGTFVATLTQIVDPCRGNPACRLPVQVRQVATTSVIASAASTTAPSFTATPTSGAAPLQVGFSYLGSEAGPLTIDYGDGLSQQLNRCQLVSGSNTGTCQPFSSAHTYASAGTYTARLINPGGCSAPANRVQELCLGLPDQILGTVTITVTGGTGSSCVALTHNMGPGDTDAMTSGDVTRLQEFLRTNPTGSFDNSTVRAVQQWQSAHGLVSSGTPDTTGYGYVGPRTRAAMQSNCTTGQNFSATPTSGTAPLTVSFSSNISGFHPEERMYVVDYGDGTRQLAAWCDSPTDRCQSPGINVHTYAVAGTYIATLKLFEGSHCGFDANGNPLSPGTVTCMSVDAVSTLGSATVTVSGGSGTSCVALTHNMGPEDTDATTAGDVSRLQNFLVGLGLLDATLPHGFYGPSTVRAVQAWQNSHGLITSGDPDSTGYGFVGPRTRAAMAQGCNPSASFTATPISGGAPLAVRFSNMVGGPLPGRVGIDYGDGSSEAIVHCTAGGTAAPDRCTMPGINTHTYTSAGTYTAKLVSTTFTCQGAAVGSSPACPVQTTLGTATVTVTGGGSGSLSAAPTSGAAPLLVSFTLPNRPGTMILDFGDGAQSSMTAAQTCIVPVGSLSGTDCTPRPILHTYTAVGTYTALLTQVTGGTVCPQITYDPNDPLSFQDIGNTSTLCVNQPAQTVFLGKVIITVAAATPAPTVSCAASPASVALGGTTTWTATAQGGTGAYSYAWSDTAGHTQASASTTFGPFAYSAVGSAGASVIILDSNNQRATASCTTTITAAPVPVVTCPAVPEATQMQASGAPTIIAEPADMPSGCRARVSWSAPYGSTCDYSSPTNSPSDFPYQTWANTGSTGVGPLTQDATYAISCGDAAYRAWGLGWQSASVSIKVRPR